MTESQEQEKRIKGIGVSPGICIGKAYLVDREGVDVVEKYFIGVKNLPDEIKRFKLAVKKSKEELSGIIEKSPEELRDHIALLETQMAILKDKMLYGNTIKIIENELVNAEWALKKVVSRLKATFRSISDPYLQERTSDITHVSDQIMNHLTGAKKVNIAEIEKRVILVAQDLSPAEASQIKLERIKGFLTELGGKTSHTGIIARTLEIPAVMGLGNAIRTISNDEILIVDGSAGTVIIHPTEESLVEYGEKKERYEAYQATIKRSAREPVLSLDGQPIDIMGNIELPEEVVSVLDYGGDGIGLYRTEFQYMNRPQFPTESELYEKYAEVVEIMAPKPVTIRTLDINGDKALAPGRIPADTNPALGLRAIRYCLKRPDVFLTQIRAILRAAAKGSVRILLPLISSAHEVQAAKRFIAEAASQLKNEGLSFDADIEVGIMIEVPSAVVMADVLATQVDFFSLGTNDLIQYSLAIDRGNIQVAHLYNPLHPAVLRMIKQTCDAAKKAGIRVFICGEMASEPIYLPLLLGMGMDELSMNPTSIPSVKRFARLISVEEAEVFTEKALAQTDPLRLSEMLAEKYGDLISEKPFSPDGETISC